jgi:putative spermidine/putrescine transport system permease protein
MRTLKVTLNILVVVALIYLVLPLVAVIPLSLTDQRMLSFPSQSLSLQHYEAIIHNGDWLNSAWTSLKIGAVSTILSLALGTSAAIGCWMTSRSNGFRIIYMLPLIVPHVILALGTYRLFVLIGLLDTFAGVVLVHVVGAIPLVFVAVSIDLQYLDKTIVRAARSLGSGVVRSTYLVILPNLRTGLLSGAVFAFLHSWDEIVITLFVSGRAIHTLPRKMWEGLNDNFDPAIASVAVLLITVTLVLLLVEQRYSSRDRRIKPSTPK